MAAELAEHRLPWCVLPRGEGHKRKPACFVNVVRIAGRVGIVLDEVRGLAYNKTGTDGVLGGPTETCHRPKLVPDECLDLSSWGLQPVQFKKKRLFHCRRL